MEIIISVATDIGEQRYLEFYKILQEFIEKKTPFDFILNTELKDLEEE